MYDDPAVGDRLHALAITEHALLAHAVRVVDGMDKRKALAMLMAGRHLSGADMDFVLSVAPDARRSASGQGDFEVRCQTD